MVAISTRHFLFAKQHNSKVSSFFFAFLRSDVDGEENIFFHSLQKEAKWIDFCPESPSLSHFSRSSSSTTTLVFVYGERWKERERGKKRERKREKRHVAVECGDIVKENSSPLNNITTHIISYTRKCYSSLYEQKRNEVEFSFYSMPMEKFQKVDRGRGCWFYFIFLSFFCFPAKDSCFFSLSYFISRKKEENVCIFTLFLYFSYETSKFWYINHYYSHMLSSIIFLFRFSTLQLFIYGLKQFFSFFFRKCFLVFWVYNFVKKKNLFIHSKTQLNVWRSKRFRGTNID